MTVPNQLSNTPVSLPDSLEDAIEQAINAIAAGLDAGISHLSIDLRFQELKTLAVAEFFARYFAQRYGANWSAIFADAGAAALAQRDWVDLPMNARRINEGRAAIRPEDQAVLLISPTSMEVEQVEKLLELAGDRPVVLLNPRLENAEVGVGLAARRMRERFVNRFTVAYYLQPLPLGAVWRCYPQGWQVWQQLPDGAGDVRMQCVAETDQRPSGDDVDRLFRRNSGQGTSSLLDKLQQFISALAR